MPYIKPEARLRLSRNNGSSHPRDAGELNYKLARIIDEYCEDIGFKYQTANDIIGVLVCLKDEFQRRFTNSYEDFKKIENGEVFVYMSERIKEIEYEKTRSK